MYGENRHDNPSGVSVWHDSGMDVMLGHAGLAVAG
jgi:hypothetical protein